MIRVQLLLIVSLLQVSCTGLPDNIQPVTDFELDKYLGQWYEIARLDHSFEAGLSHVTANYSLRGDGGVEVINKGFIDAKQKWKTAEGKAYFVKANNLGHLKVSFFGPFYGSYVVFKLDKPNYQYAFVTSYNKKYLWLLSRTPKVSDELMNDFLNTVKSYGFDTEQLIFVNQTKEHLTAVKNIDQQS